MKDTLLDLIQHTHGLGVIDLVKVSGTDKETQIAAVTPERNLIVFGTFKNPIAEFIGTFGMPNLEKVKLVLSFDELDENSTINLVRGTKDDPNAPCAIHFETKSSDFMFDYRLMSQTLIEDKVKNIQFKGTTWNLEFEPTVLGIQRLKKQASLNSEQSNFITKTEQGNLKIYLGDPSSHLGNFVFQSNVKGNLTKAWPWPVKIFLSIMDLPGDKTVRIADAGVIEVTVDSGLAVWRYMLPALTK